MMGITKADGQRRGKLVPPSNHGVKLMSMGFLIEVRAGDLARADDHENDPAIHHAVEWGELDYLLVDLPPGTGDAQFRFARRCRWMAA